MSKGIKCIICQSWDVVSADGYKIESRTCYVTNEDGTPHVYDTINKARADIRGNYGRYPNARGFLRDVYTDEYSGKTTYSYISIIREDSDDYEYAMRRAEQQATATTKQAEEAETETTDAPRVIDYIDRNSAEELHTLRIDQLWSWYELATINGITTRQAREVFRIIHNNIPCLFEDEANKETHEANISAACAAYDEASEARRMAEDAAVEENHEQAAAHAAEAREAAERAEKIAKDADDSARTGNACSVAEYIAEMAYYARESATRATETAELAAAEAGAPEDIAHYCHEQARRYSWTEEETAEEIAYYTNLRTANAAARALLDAYAEATGDYLAEDSDEARAAYKVARRDIVHQLGSTRADRETVARMVERIAESADPLAKYRDNPYLTFDDEAATEEAAAACEAGNINIYNEETGEYIAANLAPAGMADALVNAFCSNGTPAEVYDACIALADAYTSGEDTSAEEAALGVQVTTGPFVKEWHMAVNIGGNVEDFTDTLAEDAANEACARETLRRRWNHKKERRFYLAPNTERIVDIYYNLI